MTLYALINRDLSDTGRRKRIATPPPGPDDLASGKPYYVPVNVVETDTSTGTVPVVTSDWTETVINNGTVATELRRERTRRDMTTAELDARDDAQAQAAMNNAGVVRALARVAFNQENRLRTLEGVQPVTADQFKDALKGLIRGS